MLKRLLPACTALALLTAPVGAQSITTLQAQVNALPVPNGTGQITGAMLQTIFQSTVAVLAAQQTAIAGPITPAQLPVFSGGAVSCPGGTGNCSINLAGATNTGVAPGSVPETLQAYLARTVWADSFGAKGDYLSFASGAATVAGSTAATFSTASFVVGDVGKGIVIPGAGASGAPLVTTISVVNSATSVTLGTAASTAVSSGQWGYGTDNKGAIQAAETGPLAGGVIVRLTCSSTYYASGLTILDPSYSIEGCQQLPDVANSGANPAKWNTLGGIALSPTGNINVAGGRLRRALVKAAGLNFPQTGTSAYAGTALLFGGTNGPHVEDVTALGFNTCLAESGSNVSRFFINGLYCDGINGELITLPSTDSSVAVNIHNYPDFAQTYQSAAGAAQKAELTRSGAGFSVTAENDGLYMNNVFTFGYLNGVVLSNTGAITSGFVWADYPVAYASGSGSTCVTVGPSAFQIKMDVLWSFSCQTGLLAQLGSGGTNGNKLTIGQYLASANTSDAVDVTSGDLIILNEESLNNGGSPLNITSAASTVFMRGTTLGDNGGSTSTPPVNVPTGGDSNLVDVAFLKSDKVPGVSMFGGNVLYTTTLTSAATLALPQVGNTFTVSGTTAISNITGGAGPREVVLQFSAATPVTSTASGGAQNTIVLAVPFTGSVGATLRLRWSVALNQWVEAGRGPVAPGAGAWSGYTPVATCGTGALGAGAVVSGTFNTLGKTTNLQVDINLTAASSIGTCAGSIAVSLPNIAVGQAVLAGAEFLSTGNSYEGRVGVGGTTANIVRYDNTFALAQGYRVTLNGVYQNQ